MTDNQALKNPRYESTTSGLKQSSLNTESIRNANDWQIVDDVPAKMAMAFVIVSPTAAACSCNALADHREVLL